MANKKGFSVLKLIFFLLSLVVIGLFAYGALMQPLFKVSSGEKYLDYYNLIIKDFPDLLKSSAKDKFFPIILFGFLLGLLGGAVLFTGISSLVVLVSGLLSLFTRRRLKTIWSLIADSFHLGFISVMTSSYYVLDKVELGMGGILILVAIGLSIVIYALEDYFYGNNKTISRLIGTIVRIAISGAFVYISLFSFREIYRLSSETEGYGQYLFSDYLYLSRIEDDLPKKLFAFLAVFTFAIGLLVNTLVPMLPAICGSRSMNENDIPKNRNKKFIAQSIVMPILLIGAYYGTIYVDENPSQYAMGSGLLTMLIVFVVAFAVSIVAAIIDPKSKYRDDDPVPQVAPQPQVIAQPQPAPQPRKNAPLKPQAAEEEAPQNNEQPEPEEEAPLKVNKVDDEPSEDKDENEK